MWPILALFALGCALEEEDFVDRYAEELCRIDEECFREEFVLVYGADQQLCQEKFVEALEAELFENGCRGYEVDPARECLKDLKDSSCRTWQADAFVSEDCQAIWVCESNYTNE